MKLKLGIGFGLFLFLALLLLIKDPIVFPDESSGARIALSFINKKLFSTTVFSNQLAKIEFEGLAFRGPIYFWLLAVVFKVFGFGIFNLRLTSVVIGLGIIAVVVWLIKELEIDSKLTWLPVVLMAVDYSFLRMVRFGRPDVLVSFFGVLGLVFYIKLLKKVSFKNYFFLGLFLTLGVLSHLALGLVVVVGIALHVLLAKKISLLKTKHIILPILLSVLSIGGWVFYCKNKLSNSGKVGTTLAISRLSPSFRSVKMILAGDIELKIIYLLFCLILIVFWLMKRKNKQELLWSVVSLVMVAGVIFGGLDWYLGLLAVPIYIAATFLIDVWQKMGRKTEYNLMIMGICTIFILNVVKQLKLNVHYSDYSYNDYSEGIAKNLPIGAKVWIRQLMPDISFYLVEKRPDLHLAFGRFFKDDNDLKQHLAEADYVITYGHEHELIRLSIDADPEQVKKIFSEKGIDPVLADFLKKNELEVFIVDGDRKYYSTMVIYKIKRS